MHKHANPQMGLAQYDNANVYKSFKYYLGKTPHKHAGKARVRVGQAVIPRQLGWDDCVISRVESILGF